MPLGWAISSCLSMIVDSRCGRLLGMARVRLTLQVRFAWHVPRILPESGDRTSRGVGIQSPSPMVLWPFLDRLDACHGRTGHSEPTVSCPGRGFRLDFALAESCNPTSGVRYCCLLCPQGLLLEFVLRVFGRGNDRNLTLSPE